MGGDGSSLYLDDEWYSDADYCDPRIISSTSLSLSLSLSLSREGEAEREQSSQCVGLLPLLGEKETVRNMCMPCYIYID